MEDNLTPEVEEVSADQTDMFDGWDTDESPAEETVEEPAEERTEETEPAADESAEPEEPAQEPQQDTPFLTLKHLDETRTVTREEAVELAQKGMDYDRVKEKLDELRTFKSDNQDAIDLIQSYAERNGMTIPEYLDFCRTQDIMHEKGVSEDEAKAQLALEKRERAVAKKEAEQQAREQAETQPKPEVSEQERVRQEVQQFMAVYPDVKPEDIPQDVFEIIQREKVPLTVAYGKWRIAQQEKELSSLRAQDSARKKSPGSLSGSLKTPKRDPAFDGWDD